MYWIIGFIICGIGELAFALLFAYTIFQIMWEWIDDGDVESGKYLSRKIAKRFDLDKGELLMIMFFVPIILVFLWLPVAIAGSIIGALHLTRNFRRLQKAADKLRGGVIMLYTTVLATLFIISGSILAFILLFLGIDLFLKFITDGRASIGGIKLFHDIGRFFCANFMWWIISERRGNYDVATDDRIFASIMFWLFLALGISMWPVVLPVAAIMAIGLGIRKFMRLHYRIKDKMAELELDA